MFRRLLSLVLAAAALTAGAIHGQCIGPDNLNGPCCAQLGANLPNFPAITLPGLGICWSSCTPTTTCTNVTLGMPVQTSCGQFSVPMNVNDCAGVPLLTSKLHLDYTRTWMEFPAPGAQIQVWRFVVKADVFPSPVLPPVCPVPSCLGPHPSAFYYGYLDYAFDCAAGGWRSALVLFHGCDKFQHDPLLSDKPGVFHPTMSFALVAPSTAANPFVPALSPGPVGPVFAEALRNVPDPAVTLSCIAEEVIVQGVVAFLGQACACPFAFVPPQVTARHITASTNCGSNFTSLNVFSPMFPWFEDMTTSIGMWTTGASYPGPEVVWVDEGVYLHNDVCSSTGALVPYGEIKYGATTLQGFPAQSLTGQVLNKFTDLVNNFSFKVGAAILPPFVGSVKPSVHLAYLNYF